MMDGRNFEQMTKRNKNGGMKEKERDEWNRNRERRF